MKKALLILIVFTCWTCNKEEGNVKEIKRIEIQVEETIKSDWVHGRLITNEKELDCRIKIRGGYSRIYPKKSYEIDLNEDIGLLSLPEDDDWILNANYIDKTFLRHTVSYQIFESMDGQNQIAQFRYTELYINDEYSGLYVLMEKMDKSSISISNSMEGFLFKEPHLFKSNYKGLDSMDVNFHQQIYPDVDESNLNFRIEELRQSIIALQGEEFEAFIKQNFNLKSIIDWHLLLLLSNNNDGILKNFYLYKNADHKLSIIPWDYDHSFGRDGDNELNLIRPLNIHRSILFKKLLNTAWYTVDLKDRWNDLIQKNILSKKAVKNRFQDISTIVEPHIEKNQMKWPISGGFYYDSNTFYQEIELINQYLDLRYPQLIEYFDQL